MTTLQAFLGAANGFGQKRSQFVAPLIQYTNFCDE